MKNSLLIFLIAIVQVSASVSIHGQNLTLMAEGNTVREVFKQIENEINYRFLYDEEFLDLSKSLSFEMRDYEIDEVLDMMLENSDVTYRILEDNVVVITPFINEQQITVTGQVLDASTGQPLPGASIVIQGTTTGTVSNLNGEYSISVPGPDAVLVFSFVGYISEVLAVGERTTINVSLSEDVRLLEEIVVIGYGRQARINLTGSVDQVTNRELENRPVQNLVQGLQGLMPNVNIDLRQGKPIESPSINIRGVTSIGQGGNALVLIDGVEGDPSMLNPNNIQSVSVLKDASAAAVYGARGAFGVVLIETKQAERDQFSINYATNYAFKTPTVYQGDFEVDPYIWTSKFVESFQNWEGTFPRNVNKTLPFSEEYFAEIERRAADPSLPRTWVDDDGTYRYAHANNWYDHLYSDVVNSTDHNLTITSGTDNARFVLSGRYQGQDGLYRYSSDDYNIYNISARTSVDLTSWLEVNNNFSYSSRNYFNPLTVGEGGNIWRNIADEGHPLVPMFNPDGTMTHSAIYTVGNLWYDSGGFNFERSVLSNKTGLQSKFFDDKLSIMGDFSIQRRDDEETRYRYEIPYSRAPGHIAWHRTEYNDLRVTNTKRDYYTANLFAEYEDTFAERHYVRTLVGYNYEEFTYNRLRAFRDGLIFKGADDLNLALGGNVDTQGGYERWVILGGFVRLNYIYDNRYLIEFSGRYDGSSKFPADERYAFFPSASIGWRISEESFWPVPDNIVNHLQLRASYGSMGNGAIQSYVFMETFDINRTSRILLGDRPRKTSSPDVLPDGLTWETATTSNIGLDLDMFERKFVFSADAFVRATTNMFAIALTPPAIFGTSPPMGNYADLETRGWELQASWRDRFVLNNRPFNYNFGFSLADSKAKITRYNNPEKFLNDFYKGMIIGEFWGYETEGFFVDQADINSHADQSRFRSTSWGEIFPGDLKLRDLDGDGVIGPGDNTLDNPGDRRIIGNTEPRYRIGFNLGAEWNSIFISAFFQGILKQDWYPRHDSNLFWGQYNRPYGDIPKWHLAEGVIWTEDNPSQDAFFPRYVARLANRSGAIIRSAQQTQYLMDMKYIRMKNLQIGYHLPARLIQRAGMQSATIYMSAENLWTWAPFYDLVTNLDVENASNTSDALISTGHGDGYNYPMLKSVSFGLSVTF